MKNNKLNERYLIFLEAYPGEPRPGDKNFKNHLPYMEWISRKKSVYLAFQGKTDIIIDQDNFTEFLKNNPK